MVEYLCVAAAHAPRSLGPGGGLTVHLGEWAYCPAGESSDHGWFETGGIEIVGLTRFAPRAPMTDDSTAERFAAAEKHGVEIDHDEYRKVPSVG